MPGAWPEPEWQTSEAVRQADGSLEKTLADIDSHMPAGHQYRDSRHVTWAHETTHGLNGRLRNVRIELEPCQVFGFAGMPAVRHSLPRPAGPINPSIAMGSFNCCYCLENRYFRAGEPPLTLAKIAAAVPQALRGMSYQLYLIQQQRYWNNEPLYVLDELSAYSNGLQTALDAGGGDGQYSDALQALEFVGYAFTLLKLLDESGGYESNPVIRFMAWQGERVLGLWRKAKEISRLYNPAQDAIVAALGEGELSGYIQAVMGQKWFNEVLLGHEWNGMF